MGRPPGCGCHCSEPPPPDCFGCTDPGNMFPSVWQLDMPSSITKPTNTSCGPVSNTDFFGIRNTLQGYVEYPSIPSTSLLIVDDRPIANYAFDYVTCVWLSNDFWMYEIVQGEVIDIRMSGACPHGGHYPYLSKGPDQLGPTPWYYYQNPYVGVSPNRTRVNISTDYTPNTLCGTRIDPVLAQTYNCSYAPYGVQWYLSIESSSGVKKLVALLRYFFRLDLYFLREQSFFPLGYRPILPSFHSYAYAPYQIIASRGFWPDIFLGGPDCKAALFPGYTGISDNINLHWSDPAIIRYEKVIDCETDFDGTPVVLTKAYDIKNAVTSTKTKREMMGMGTTPAYITLTPVI